MWEYSVWKILQTPFLVLVFSPIFMIHIMDLPFQKKIKNQFSSLTKMIKFSFYLDEK